MFHVRLRRIYTLLLLAGIFYRCLLSLVYSFVQGFLFTFYVVVIVILETGIPNFPIIIIKLFIIVAFYSASFCFVDFGVLLLDEYIFVIIVPS